MITQLRTVNHIYDLMALCCSYILRKIEEKPYDFAAFIDEEYDEIYDAIEYYCMDKEDRGSDRAFVELRDNLLEIMDTQVTIAKCYAVVKYMDDLIEVEIKDKLLAGSSFVSYTALNEQYVDRVRIFPVMKQSILTRGNQQFMYAEKSAYPLLRDRRECSCSSLDKLLANYIIFDKEHIKKYPVTIFHASEKSEIYKHFCAKKELVFGIVPVTDQKLEDILKIGYQGKSFHVEYMYPEAEKKLKERYRDIYERCCGRNIDFLIFPEMLMTKEIMSAISVLDLQGIPKITVNGSIWEDYANRAIITDLTGKTIFSYYKKDTYEHEEIIEHLKQDRNQEYFLIEIENLGRIGVCICKDLINEQVKTFHRIMGTDLLLVPAYSPSMDLTSSAETMSQEYNCIVVVANACSALKEERKAGNRIGFVTVPAKKGSDRTRIIKRYVQNECIKECTQRCMGKMITIDFYCTEVYEDGISFQISDSCF